MKKKESKKLLRVPRAKKRNIGGGSPRIDACRVLRVFLRPSRRWNRGGFESGSRRREDLQIKKLRPSGRKVITKNVFMTVLETVRKKRACGPHCQQEGRLLNGSEHIHYVI